MTTKLKVIAVIIVVILIAAIILYRTGKKKGQSEGVINISKPPEDGGGKLTIDEINVLVKSIYDDMAGVNFAGHDIETWKKILSLSNTDFVKVYNEFNNDYQVKSKESLKSWLQNESSYLQPQWDLVKQTVIERMNNLNLL